MTPTTELKLHDGEIIRTPEDPKELAERIQIARQVGTLVEVVLGDAELVRINPDAVVMIGKPASRGGQFA